MGPTSSSCAVRSRSLPGWMDCGEEPTAWFAHVSVSSPSFPGGMLPLPACPSSCDASFIDKGQGFEPNQAGSPPEGPPFVLVDRHGPSETAVFTRSFSIGGDLSSTLDDRSLPFPRTGSARGSHPFDPGWKGRSLGSVPGSKPGDAQIDEPQIIRTCCACCAPRRRVRSIRRETCSKKGRFQRVWRPGRWERKGRSTWWCVIAAKWKERRSCGGNEACVGSKPRLAVRKHAQERKKGQVLGSGRKKARVQVSGKIPLYHSGGVE